MTVAEILSCRGSDADLDRIARDQARQLQSMMVEIDYLQAAIKRPVLSRKPLPRRNCVQRRRGAGRPAGRPAARACSSGRSDPDLSDLADADRARLRVLLAARDGSDVGVFNARHDGREHADNGVAL